MKKAFGFLVALALVGLAAVSFWNLKRDKASTPSVSGTIETDEVRVASRYGGRVEKIFAQEGDQLKPGQLLVELEAAELHARRESAVAMLAELEAGPRKEEIAALRSEWEAQQAELDLARADDKRMRDLFAKQTVSEAERDRMASRARVLEKNVASAKARYDLLAAGTRPEKLAQARAQLAEIDVQLREMKILAPSEAVLELLSVKIGDVLPPHREVATLILPQHLWVRVYVPEPWLGRLKVSQTVRVRVDAWPERDFKGEVEQINRVAEFTPRNAQTIDERIKQVFGVKVRLANDNDRLRGGMSADVFFPEVSGQTK